MVGGRHQKIGGASGPFGESTSKADLLMESVKPLIGPTALFVEFWILVAMSPHFSSLLPVSPNHLAMLIPSVFWVREKQVCLLVYIPYSWKAGLLLATLSLAPVGEIGAEEVFLGIRLCHLGSGVMQIKWNSSSYPLHCVYSWIIFFSSHVLDFQTPTMVLSSMEVVKIDVL